MSVKEDTSTSECAQARVAPGGTLTLPDTRSIQRALVKVVDTLNNPEYQEQLTKLTQASVKNSLQTLQKLSHFSARVADLDSKGWASVINGTIDNLMRTYLQFNSDLIVILQRLSSKTFEILNDAVPSEEDVPSEEE